MGARTEASVMPLLASTSICPAAVAPPWLPMPGTTKGCPPASRTAAATSRTATARFGMPRLLPVMAIRCPDRTPARKGATSRRVAAATSGSRGRSKLWRTRMRAGTSPAHIPDWRSSSPNVLRSATGVLKSVLREMRLQRSVARGARRPSRTPVDRDAAAPLVARWVGQSPAGPVEAGDSRRRVWPACSRHGAPAVPGRLPRWRRHGAGPHRGTPRRSCGRLLFVESEEGVQRGAGVPGLCFAAPVAGLRGRLEVAAEVRPLPVAHVFRDRLSAPMALARILEPAHAAHVKVGSAPGTCLGPGEGARKLAERRGAAPAGESGRAHAAARGPAPRRSERAAWTRSHAALICWVRSVAARIISSGSPFDASLSG